MLLQAFPAYAGHNGDVSCDPSWSICLQSMSMDMGDTVHFVSSIVVNGASFDMPNDKDQIAIRNADGAVMAQTLSGGALMLGEINEPVGSDAQTAMSRGLQTSPGISLQVSAQAGADVERCNATALGFIYERAHYHTQTAALQITQNGSLVNSIQSSQLIQPAYSVTSSPFPCKNGQ